MKYQAIAVGQMNDSHPIHIYGANLEVVRKWAQEISAAQKCVVEIYELRAVLVETVQP